MGIYMDIGWEQTFMSIYEMLKYTEKQGKWSVVKKIQIRQFENASIYREMSI